MPRHTVNHPPAPPPRRDMETGDIYVTKESPHGAYILTQTAPGRKHYMLVSLETGVRWADPSADPFGGERESFALLPGDHEITIA